VGGAGKLDSLDGDWSFLGAIYDGDPDLKDGDPTNPGHNQHGINWRLGTNGVVVAAEVHYYRNRDGRNALPGVVKPAGYYMTGKFQDIGETAGSTVRGNAMAWLLADQMLYRRRPGSEIGLSWFGALVVSLADNVNDMTSYFNTGLVYRGLFPTGPADTTGFAVTAGWYSDDLDKARRAQGKSEKDYEAVLELNHTFVLGRGLSFQPDIQYVIRPAGTGTIDNALVIGAKVAVQF